MMKQIILLGAAICSLLLVSCNKEEGRGGRASIKGQLKSNVICSETGEEMGISAITGERVYISYGGGNQYDDNVRSGSNGYFEFDFLHPGTYRISALADCDTCLEGNFEVSTTIEIDRKDEADIGILQIQNIDNDFCSGPGEGGSSIAIGELEALFVDGNNFDTIRVELLYDERVYIMYGENEYHSDDVRSSGNGTYAFNELRIGKYKLFAYSDCAYCPNEKVPVFLEFEITEQNQQLTLPKLQVVKLI